MKEVIQILTIIFVCIVFVLSSIIIMLNLTSKDKENSNSIKENEQFITDELTNNCNEVIQKTVYDKESGLTYIYTFSYESNMQGGITTPEKIIILDKNGNIIKD